MPVQEKRASHHDGDSVVQDRLALAQHAPRNVRRVLCSLQLRLKILHSNNAIES